RAEGDGGLVSGEGLALRVSPRASAELVRLALRRISGGASLRRDSATGQRRTTRGSRVPRTRAELERRIEARRQFTFTGERGVDAAFGLVPALPAARTRVFARCDLVGAGAAADRGIALRDERVRGQVVLG